LKRSFRAATLAVLIVAPGAAAQTVTPPPPDASAVRVRLGPLLINPSLALTNLGVDTNVFRTATDPKRDFTFTVTPAANVWLGMGRTWVAGAVREDIVWYKTYASERSVNNRYAIGWLVPLARIAFDVGVDALRTRERPGFEIDVRAERDELGYGAGVELRALSRTLFGIRGDRRVVDFGSDAVFRDRRLRDQLNRTDTSGAVTIRHELTPLTSITFAAGRRWERFEFEPSRDSESTTASAGVRFDPSALISGSASVGFRHFDPVTPDVPGFRGTTAAVDLAYVALGVTRIAVQASRDIQHSFRIEQPYYLQASFAGSLAQQIYGPLDVEARVGVSKLEYRNRSAAGATSIERVDRVRSYGAGVGYHLGTDLRVGVNVDQQRRESPVPDASYEGLLLGASVVYGR
jgi:hypothetical protein